jgi:hypothetical protein
MQIDAVSVIYTGFDETFEAARVGAGLAVKMNVPLRIVHVRKVPPQLDLDRPDGLSPVETEAFATRLVDAGISARVRVYLCRDETKTIPYAFKPVRSSSSAAITAGCLRESSACVMRSKTPDTSSSWWIHPKSRSTPMLDLFYLAVGVVGFIALWGITKACERA